MKNKMRNFLFFMSLISTIGTFFGGGFKRQHVIEEIARRTNCINPRTRNAHRYPTVLKHARAIYENESPPAPEALIVIPIRDNKSKHFQ